MSNRNGQIVLVLWDDSNVTHGWLPDNGNYEPIAHCRTVGILKGGDDRQIELAFGDSDCGSKMETIAIPKGCITAIRKLRVR